jgi:hypothetical protein
LGLSEYRGKITGYTYTTFIESDTFYYSVKRIKAERKDGKLVVEDVEMIGNNFPEKAAKHVKQTTTFPLINDTTIDITNGHWSTNQTKKYYSIAGSAKVKAQEEEKESDLLAHLQEMKVKSDIAVNKKEKKRDEPVVKNSVAGNPQPNNNSKIQGNKNSGSVAKSSSVPKVEGQVSQTKSADVVKSSQTPPSEIQMNAGTNNVQKKEEVKSSGSDNKTTNVVANTKVELEEDYLNQRATTGHTSTISVGHTQQNSATNADKSINQPQVSEQKKIVALPAAPIADQSSMSSATVTIPQLQNKQLIQAKELPASVSERKNETIQSLYFKNDSLVLSLYDNGIVDGDTVSVFVNGENIISRQKLKEAATKKTIYIPSNTDSVQLVLFAENLGTIPPNTGLLTVRDGDDVYQVRFSADLQKNASIFLRRKKDQ